MGQRYAEALADYQDARLLLPSTGTTRWHADFYIGMPSPPNGGAAAMRLEGDPPPAGATTQSEAAKVASKQPHLARQDLRQVLVGHLTNRDLQQGLSKLGNTVGCCPLSGGAKAASPSSKPDEHETEEPRTIALEERAREVGREGCDDG